MSDQPQYPSYPGDDSSGGVPPGYQPPPPGYQPPPPGYGQAPPAYGQVPGGYGQVAPNYASWGSRVGAALLDALIAFGIFLIPLIVGLVITFQNAEYNDVTEEFTGIEPLGILVLVLTTIASLAFEIWNRGVRVGKTGQSLGKKIVGISVVRVDNGAFLGAGGGFLRWLVGTVFNGVPCLGLIDVLWPLWDERKQTLHDKVISSVAIRV